MRNKNRYRLGIILRDGTEYAFEVPKIPAHWASWLLQQLPYGTPSIGASFYRERLQA
jgi:hypothetical protein